MNDQEHQSDVDTALETVTAKASLLSKPPSSNQSLGIKASDYVEQGQNKEMEIRLRISEEIHQYVREYIRMADQKSAFFFAGVTALLAYLNSLGITKQWVSNPTNWQFIDFLSFIATVGFIISGAAFAFTIMPRTNGSRRGLIFYAAIQEHENSQSYAKEVSQTGLQEFYVEKLKHIHDLSGICQRKFSALKFGQWLGIVATTALMLLFIFK